MGALICPQPFAPPTQKLLKMSTPLVIDESLVSHFKYWKEGIRQGIRFNNELYSYSQSYSVNERLKAYEMAYQQTEQGVAVCITVSKSHYTIWLSLRSLSQATDVRLLAVE